MNADSLYRDHHPQRHRARHHRRVRRGHADAGGRVPAHRHRARRPARRARRPRPGTGGTRGGAAGPGEPARRDPRDPRGRRRRRARPARLPARRTRLDRRPGATPGGGHEHLPADPQADPPRPPRRACSPSWSSTARSPSRPACSSPGSAWRYRSEIAPATTAGAVLAAGWWLHHGHPGLWPWLLAVSDLAAFALFVFGARIGLSRLAERVYAAAAVLAAGGWLAVAALLGPFTSPMPQVLGVGALILAVPWWAHRRRRARVRVQRALAAWPDISKAIGLPGSKIQSASVDLWGWRARRPPGPRADHRRRDRADTGDRIGARHLPRRGPRLPDRRRQGQPVRTARPRHRPARRGDPAGPGPSARSITEPVDLGPFEDAEPCRVSFLRRHALFAGTTGSGKSGGLNVLMATLAACDDVVIWAIDLKKGMELGPGRRASTGSPPRPRRPPRCSPTRSRSCRPAPRTWPRPAAASGNRPRTCPRW